MPSIISEHEQHIDSGGKPIVNGTIHIGARNTDPTLLANKITIYSDRALSTPLANPQATDADGRSVNKIWVPGRYSIVVQDSESAQQYSELDAGENPETGISALTNVQGTNTITADGDPTIDTLLDQQAYIFRAAGGNTGAVTLQIDLTAAKSVLKQHDVALVSGDIEANQTIYVVYNALDDTFEMINQPIVLSATDFNVSNDLTVGNDATVSGNTQIDGNLNDSNGNEFLTHTNTALAVNHPKSVNSAAGNATGFEADGTDANIDFDIDGKGTGSVNLAGTSTGPVNVRATPVYGYVSVDPPEQVLSTSTPATAATAVNSTTLNTAVAVRAVLHITATKNETAALPATNIVGIGSSSSVTATGGDVKCSSSAHVLNVVAVECVEIMIDLDVNNDFWYITSQTGTTTTEVVTIYLTGYYV